jgi:hypothetical protein
MMPSPIDKSDSTELEPREDFTATELDDLIWDIALGRPTRVVLNTAAKRATFFAVNKKIHETVATWHMSRAPG